MKQFDMFSAELTEGHIVNLLTGTCSCGDPTCKYLEGIMGRQELKTYSGYDFYEVSSAMQKMIRRGKEEDAAYWALELEPFFYKYMWKRLVIISHEEIGIANPMAPVIIETYKEQYMALRDKKSKERFLIIGNAIMFLCREPKCRIGDDFINIIRKLPRRREIPDVALDAHTLRGKRLGRGWDQGGNDFWYNHSSKVENEIEGLNIYLSRRKEGTALPVIFDPDM